MMEVNTAARCASLQADEFISSIQHQAVDDDVKDVERAFVERKFRKASRLARNVLTRVSTDSRTTNLPCADVVELQTVPPSSTMRLVERKFRVDFSSEISPPDQAAAVLLQCCYEVKGGENSTSVLARQSVEAFLDCYCDNHRPLPIEAAVIWIQYSHAVGYHHHALEMTAELLNFLISQDGSLPKEDGWCNELIWFLLAKSLPNSANPSHVSNALERIKAQNWKPFSWNFVASPRPNEESVRIVLSGLEAVSHCRYADCSVKNCIHECRVHLKAVLSEVERDRNLTETVDARNSTNMNGRNASSSLQKILPSLRQSLFAGTNWQTQVVQSLLHYVRVRVIVPLCHSEEVWANRGRVAFSLFLTYVAWKRRRRIASGTKAVGKITLSPFLEIVEAIAPQSARHRD